MTLNINTILKTVLTASLLYAAAPVSADPVPSPRVKPSAFTQGAYKAPKLDEQTKIGFARIQEGRLISAPLYELRDWANLSARLSSAHDNGAERFAPISPTALFNVTAPYEATGRESENRLDEIRLVAADNQMDYVVIYGAGRDAGWNSFGGMALRDTGLLIPAGHRLSPKGNFKALLVETRSGRIVGTITSNSAKPGQDGALLELTTRLQNLLGDLSGGAVSARTLT